MLYQYEISLIINETALQIKETGILRHKVFDMQVST